MYSWGLSDGRTFKTELQGALFVIRCTTTHHSPIPELCIFCAVDMNGSEMIDCLLTTIIPCLVWHGQNPMQSSKLVQGILPSFF